MDKIPLLELPKVMTDLSVRNLAGMFPEGAANSA